MRRSVLRKVRIFQFLVETELQAFSAYKGDILIYAVGSFALPLILMQVWVTVAESSSVTMIDSIYIIQYFFMQMIVNIIIGAWQSPFVSEDIAKGRINQYLLKPFSFLLYMVSENVAEKIWKIILISPAIILVFFLYQPYISTPSIKNIVLLLLTSFLGGAIYFLIHQIIGIAAFWTTNTQALRSFNEMFYFALSGKLFPLNVATKILPVSLTTIFPYKYVINFPIDVVLGKLDFSELLIGLFTQCLWITLLYILYRMLWRKGIQTYGGYGA